MKKIAVFTGTRAEYGLLYWLMKDIQADKDLALQVIVSGTHLSPEFGLTFEHIVNDGFNIDAKVENVMSSNTAVGVAKGIGLAVLGMAEELSRLAPDAVVILGDRFEALAVAQTAVVLRIPIIHLHGGEITEGAYDDSIRHAITKLSHLHFTSTEVYKERVVQLGEEPTRVFNVGAIGLDHVKRTNLMTLEALSESLGFVLDKPFFLATYHPETLSDLCVETSFQHFLDAVDEFPDHQIIITYPNADDGGRGIIDLIEAYARDNEGRVLAIPSLGFKRYLSALKHASAVIGNSSSGIIEVPTFGIPTVNVGDRQKGRLSAASVINCGSSKNEIVDAIRSALSDDFVEVCKNAENPYGDGGTSKRIIDLIRSSTLDRVKKFYDLPVEEKV